MVEVILYPMTDGSLADVDSMLQQTRAIAQVVTANDYLQRTNKERALTPNDERLADRIAEGEIRYEKVKH